MAKLRNILNIIFLLTAVVGLIYWFALSKETGTYIIMAAMIVKFIELGLRMLNIGD